MKTLFITAGIVGVVIAVLIYNLNSSENGKVMNVEDGFPVDA